MFSSKRIAELEKKIEILEYDRDNLRGLYNRLVDLVDYLDADIKKLARTNKTVLSSLQNKVDEHPAIDHLIYNHKLEIMIKDLPLTTRSRNCLINNGILSLRDLTVKTELELMRVRGFGQKCLDEIVQLLDLHGLTLGMVNRKWGNK